MLNDDDRILLVYKKETYFYEKSIGASAGAGREKTRIVFFVCMTSLSFD